MRMEKISDILSHIKDYHHKISEHYKLSIDKAPFERIRMLLNYLEIHQRYLENAVEQFYSSCPDKILNTWIGNSPCQHKIEELMTTMHENIDSVEDIIRIAIELDDCIINIYKNLKENSPTNDIRDFLDSLLQMEEKQERVEIRNLSMMNEI